MSVSSITLTIKPKAVKFIKTLPPKHKRQIKNHLLSLKDNPIPHDAKKLRSYDQYLRTDIDEYRVIYKFDSDTKIVTIVLVGKRNDSSIYRIAQRNLR